MKKMILYFMFCSFIFANTTIIDVLMPHNAKQVTYHNMVELPFGFSVDLQHYDNVVWISKMHTMHSVILSDSDDNRLILGDYPFGIPLVGKRDIYQESEFLSEITNPTDNATIVFYDNSTFYVYELNDGYKAYVVTSMHNNDILASIFRDSKFIVSFFLDRNDKKTIENILYSIGQNDKPFSKENYHKKTKELYMNDSLQKALLYSSTYYIYDKNDKENKKLLNKILNKIILNIAYIKNDINE
jgi:hypothetical protein